jgi:CRISPR/Cas system-associated protein Cas10 (large subunit of type III CRISPR-Cas system)
LAIDYSRGKQEQQGATKAQREAIVEAMRILAEEDRARGVDMQSEFTCALCGLPRTLVGSVLYEQVRLCNACALDYEVARIGHQAGSAADYVASAMARRN